MAKINDGGPAFPVHIENCTNGNMVALGVLLPPGSTVDFQGMTLRDYFAAKAMQAMAGNINSYSDADADRIASAAYGLADAMLAAREGKS
ncbi:hypothetical protein K7G19_07450 [Cupriavidus sp. DB3]|uniref:hypothetical protein n=1 Tax=Cupriavidus sp. DB3 TaxID=2873259 RepID=UPI001CF4FD2C|nr:hypothetical protein [Cupriavidus sp. DB3]MCA7083434.1 hypothetical protein [Cupriavidus sp. DB3]